MSNIANQLIEFFNNRNLYAIMNMDDRYVVDDALRLASMILDDPNMSYDEIKEAWQEMCDDR